MTTMTMTTAAAARSPWRGLPDELKVRILQYALISDPPVHFHPRVLPLLLTSKHMRSLALQVWGQNTLHLYLAPGARRIPEFPTYVGQAVRKLNITLQLPSSLVWEDIDQEAESWSGKGTPWRVLLSYKGHNTSPASQWQRVLTGLEELKVTIIIDGRGRLPGEGGCTGELEIEEFLAAASCDLRAPRVKVEVELECNGFLRDNEMFGAPCRWNCAERVADGVKSLIEGKNVDMSK